MTNPFQSISELAGQNSFDAAVKAFTATEPITNDGAAGGPSANGTEQSPHVETGLADLSASTKVPYCVTHQPQSRRPLQGGEYTPAAALALLNAHFFVGKNVQETAIFHENDDGSATYVPPDQFKLATQNIFAEIKMGGATKLISAEKFWKESQHRREKVIVFKPGGKAAPHEYNLWRGFAVEPRKGTRKQQRLLRHIWKVLSRRDPAKFKYLIRYLAWSVQNPDKQAGVVIVLKSRKQGTGKTTLGVVMLMIYGRTHGALINDSERLLGRFNDWIEPVCFIVADEILWARDHRTVDKLKSYITADTVQIERKNGAIRQVPNRLHMIMTTNHDHAVGAGVGDRRFVVYDVSDEHANDKSWFDPLYRDLEDGGASEFLYFLQNLKLGGWHPRQILKTAETVEQQRMSGDSVSQWAQACILADGIVGAERGAYGADATHSLGTAISLDALYKAYTGFCKGQHAVSVVAFGKTCAEMFGPRKRLKSLQSATPGGSKNRPWGYHVPSGTKWQEKVDAQLGIKI